MDILTLEKILSVKRLQTFYKLFPNDKEKAIKLYILNTKLAEALYPVLCNLEVVLRNSIHNSFMLHFRCENWYLHSKNPDVTYNVQQTLNKVFEMYQTRSSDALIAELTFGFWCSLFNKFNAAEYWKPLSCALPHAPIQQRNRKNLAHKLNSIRKLRNRVFHFEPIVNDLVKLRSNYTYIHEITGWIHPELNEWVDGFCRFDELLLEAEVLLHQK